MWVNAPLGSEAYEKVDIRRLFGDRSIFKPSRHVQGCGSTLRWEVKHTKKLIFGDYLVTAPFSNLLAETVHTRVENGRWQTGNQTVVSEAWWSRERVGMELRCAIASKPQQSNQSTKQKFLFFQYYTNLRICTKRLLSMRLKLVIQHNSFLVQKR